MKLLLLHFFSSLVAFGMFAQVNPNYHYVNGYTKQDGTYVQGYYRTNPNSTNTDNYSTKPNVNPWTGKPGTIEPDTYNGTNYYSAPLNTYSYPTYSTTVSTTSESYYANSTVSSEINYHNRYSLEERKAIEQLLSDLGLNTGLVDGIFTQTTIVAIEVLQMSIGVEIDGKFGDDTLNKLIEIIEEN